MKISKRPFWEQRSLARICLVSVGWRHGTFSSKISEYCAVCCPVGSWILPLTITLRLTPEAFMSVMWVSYFLRVSTPPPPTAAPSCRVSSFPIPHQLQGSNAPFPASSQDARFLFQLSVPPPPTLHTLCCVSYFPFPCQEKGFPYIFLTGGGGGEV